MMGFIKKTMMILIATLCLPAAALAQKILVYSDHEPLGGMRTKFFNEAFFPAVEQESNGRLKIEAHWNGGLAISYDALRAVGKDRAVDMAVVVPEYASADLPLHQIFKSFIVGPVGAEQVAFFRRAYAEIPELPAELLKADAVNLFCGTGYPLAFFSTAPMDGLADLKGRKWRTASFWHKTFLDKSGAEPVTMPWGDGVFKALKGGELDGLMVNVDSGWMLNVHQAAPHVLLSKDLWLGHLYLLAMNRETWDGLAEEDQAAIRRAAEKSYGSLGAVMDAAFDAQVADLRKSGAEVRLLSPGELAQWQSAVGYPEVQAAWVREREADGVENVAAVMKKIADLHEAALGASPSSGQ